MPIPHDPQEQGGPEHPLVGTWAGADEFASEVEYVISPTKEGLSVRAVDRNDGEEAEVFDVRWDGEKLTFCAHWNSTGRFAKCCLRAQSRDKVAFTYTYTDHDLLHRQ